MADVARHPLMDPHWRRAQLYKKYIACLACHVCDRCRATGIRPSLWMAHATGLCGDYQRKHTVNGLQLTRFAPTTTKPMHQASGLYMSPISLSQLFIVSERKRPFSGNAFPLGFVSV